ncbi:hypothetical protein HK098_002669 [Nowakowskiella sp. JEL0407]|nr:hypothetical protein HK098_002669 [Nowakowskiella sp. JEL0407]
MASTFTRDISKRLTNIYFFRNIVNGKVLVSPRFQLEDALLAQIGEHRPQNKIRRDHWTPFLVFTGMRREDRQMQVINDVIIPRPPKCTRAHPNGGPEVDHLPESRKQKKSSERLPNWVWSPPEGTTQLTSRLCQLIVTAKDTPVSRTEQEVGKGARALGIEIQRHFKLKPLYSVWYERPEYFDEEEWKDVGMVVERKKLKLIKGRYPVVPGIERELLLLSSGKFDVRRFKLEE